MPSQDISSMLAGLFGGLSEGLVGVAGRRYREQEAERAALRSDWLQRERTFDQLVLEGKAKPEDKAAFMAGSPTRPSVQERLTGLLDPITKATSFQEVPSEGVLEQRALAQGIPTRRTGVTANFGETPTPGSFTDLPTSPMRLPSRQIGGQATPEMDFLSHQLAEKLRSFPPTAESYIGPGEEGTSVKRLRQVSSNPATLTGRDIQTEPTAQQAAANKRVELLGGELSASVITARGRQAGAEQTARTRAQQQAEIAASGLTSQQQTAALQLSDNFTQESKDFYTVQDQFRRMMQTSRTASAAGDLTVIFAYMKMLDPTSSVREGEQATAANATGVPAQIANFYNRIMAGERLNPEQRRDFLLRAGQLYQGASTEHGRRVQEYGRRAQTLGIPPHLVVRPGAPDLGTMTTQPSDSDLLRQR